MCLVLQAPCALRQVSLQRSGHTGAEVTRSWLWYFPRLVQHLMVPCLDLFITQILVFFYLVNLFSN